MSHPYMPLFVADYLGDTPHLTTLEHGAYMLLIMSYWQLGGPLPADPKRLATIARLSTDEWTSVQRTLEPMFNVSANEWRHDRIDAELQRAREKSEKARSAGLFSAKRRSERGTPNGRSTDAQRTLNGRSTISDSDSESKKERGESNHPSEQDAAREATGGRAAAPPDDLKNAFNGSTEAMLDTVEAAMGGNCRANARRWLTGTLAAYGRERTSVAYTMLVEKQARNEPVANVLPYWSRTAQGLSAKPPPARAAPPPSRVMARLAQLAAEGASA